MAEVQHARGVKLLLKVGDGASPEVFAQMCSINADRGITFTSGTNDQPVIDCADPDALAWIAREKTDLSMSFSGGGLLNTPDLEKFAAWHESPDPKNVLVIVDVPSTDGGIIWTAKLHMTEFSLTGNRGEKMGFSGSWVSDGIVTRAPNTP